MSNEFPPSRSEQWVTLFLAALNAQSPDALTLADEYLRSDDLKWGLEPGAERSSPLDFAIWYSHGWGVSLLLENGMCVTQDSLSIAIKGLHLNINQPIAFQQRLDATWQVLRPSIMACEGLRDAAVACFFVRRRPWSSTQYPTHAIWDAMGMDEISTGRLNRCLDSQHYQARLSPLQLAWLSGWSEALLFLLRNEGSPFHGWADSAMPNWSLDQVVEVVEESMANDWSEETQYKCAAECWPSQQEKVRNRIPLAFEWSSSDAEFWKMVDARVRVMRRETHMDATLPAPSSRPPRLRF